MNFHEYRLSKNSFSDPFFDSMPWRDYYVGILNRMENGEDFGENGDIFLSESAWCFHRRAFYHVYPAVVKCLQNTSLDLSLRQLGFNMHATSLCFPVGHEPQCESRKLASMIVELGMGSVFLGDRNREETAAMRITMETLGSDGGLAFSSIRVRSDQKLSQIDFCDKDRIVSLAVGVLMLARDDRFAEPILLNRDEGKQLTPEQREAAIERAKRNGRNGLAIGKHIDASPHMRRPHFGIRWTEKGRSVPKLVPVKGCLVSRSKLYPIPTGYLDEVESVN